MSVVLDATVRRPLVFKRNECTSGFVLRQQSGASCKGESRQIWKHCLAYDALAVNAAAELALCIFHLLNK